MSSRTVLVAAVQAASVAFDLNASLDKLDRLTREAKDEGAELVVFPEAFLSAYPRYLDFVVGSRTSENREWFVKYARSSVRIPVGAVGRERDVEGGAAVPEAPEGEDENFGAFHRLQGIAADNGVFLSVGVVERSLVGATLWCTLLLFGPDGRLLSRHRKIQPTAAERVVWSQGHAETEGQDNLPVVKTPKGNMGGLICWENYMPMARYLLYKKGVEIYLAPTADGRDTWLPTMQHIAQEGRCFVVSVNQYHAPQDFPTDYPPNIRPIAPSSVASPAGTTGANGVPNGTATEKHAKQATSPAWCRGGSCIVGPLGQVIAGPMWDEEGILTANLDLDELIGAKLDFDPVGHYSREDMLLELLKPS